ncbi:MAG: 6-bladed beta-propeller, partial [Nitrospirae bacterium]|nr:6-bladed beta-propeller [Nitrospirota bacterium]
VGAYSLKGEKLFEFGKRGEGEGEFNFPTHVAVHPVTGDIYVADSMNFRIERFTPDGKFIRHLGSAGERVGSFSKLKGISVDTHGIVYAVDGLYDTVEMFNDKGEFLMNFGRAGNHEGEFWLPGGIAVSQDQIYVSDSYNQRVQVFQLINAAEADGESR